MQKIITAIFIIVAALNAAMAQSSVDYSTPQQYEIANISVTGIKYLQAGPIVKLTGLSEGSSITVPGPEIGQAIEKLWKQGLFSDANIYASKIENGKIYLVVQLTEQPRVGDVAITGVKKSKKDDIEELIDIKRGTQITASGLESAEKKIKDMYIEKGFLNTKVTVIQKQDTVLKNVSNLTFEVDKKERVKIKEINFHGASKIKEYKMRWAMKNTKRKTWYNIFKRSKYVPASYKEDKTKLIEKYKEKGYRDIEITRDSISVVDDKLINLDIFITEGNKYYFRNISWVGNTKYKTELLDRMLGIKKGDIYNEKLLDEQLFGMEGVSSIYLDNGYLFFNADPVEVNIEGDSIDIEIRIFEGRQARINKIIVKGNTKTNDHVIRREIYTKPGELFSRADIIRTQRELAQLGYFNPESMGVNPIPDPENATVDIEYTLEETSSDQIELSGGWSGKYVVGSVRLMLNNFSTRNFFSKKEWKPIPSGDGQRLSLSISVNPLWFESYNASFTEPWLGGKKPNSLTVSGYHSVRKNGKLKREDNYGRMKVTGVSVGLGRRLKWPDDYFTVYNAVNLQEYDVKNYNIYSGVLAEDTLKAKSISFTNQLTRNSVDQPIYPRSGSKFTLGLEFTPPYSLLSEKKRTQGEDMTVAERYKWIEYHKWTFKSEFYTNIVGKLVLKSKAEFGFLGYYNKNFLSPFEKYDMGGSGLSGSADLYGSEVVSLRGYDDGTLNPYEGSNLYDKFSLELRYPLILSPSATIYALAFTDAGNAWSKFALFDPMNAKRSAGIGVRLFLPMFGLIGFDGGYGFDELETTNYSTSDKGWKLHFILGQEL